MKLDDLMGWLRRGGLRRPGVAAVLATVGLVACGGTESAGLRSGDAGSAGERLGHSVSTVEVLGDLVLRSLVAQDTLALERLRLTEHEHNEVVWPELPASRPEVNYPVDMAWENIERRNRVGRKRQMAAMRGRRVSYRGVNCRGETSRFASFEVYTDCVVLFVDADGDPDRLLRVQAFKDVLSRGGGLKIFRYYGETPSWAVSTEQ
jgi:hypothetical protein